ncbi:RidA family protein [Nocardiopsis coralliicola]
MAQNYSDAVVAHGPLVFVSGQLPEAPDGSVAEGDAAGQTRQVLRNLEAVLEAHGSGLDRVVKFTYYLRHIADLQPVRQVLAEVLVQRPRPAATLVEVTGLADSRYLLAVDAVATLASGGGDQQ